MGVWTLRRGKESNYLLGSILIIIRCAVASLYEVVSVCPSVRPSVSPVFFFSKVLSTRFGRILCRVFGLVLGVTGERKARGSHNIDEEKRRDGRENRDHSNTPTRSSRKNLEGPAIATHKKKPRYLLISFPRRGIRPRQPWKPSPILLSLSSTSHPLWSRTIENPNVN